MRLNNQNVLFIPLLALFTYPTSLCNTAILLILLPSQITDLGFEENKGTIMGVSVACSSIIALIFYPIIGYYSDRTVKFFLGRRIPYMLIGTIFLCLSCLILGLSFHLAILIPGLMIWQLSYSFFIGPYYALMPDSIAPQYWGISSGWIGFLTIFGYLSGAMFSFLTNILNYIEIYLIIVLITVISSILPFLLIRETVHYIKPNPMKSFFEWFSAFNDVNYCWVYIMRFMMSVSVFLVQQYLQYYLQDVVEDYKFIFITFSSPEQVTGVTLFLILSGAMTSSIVAGKLSDKFSRQSMIYIGASIQIFSTIGLILYPKLLLIIPVSLIFGIGYGAYNTADFALAADVLPDSYYRARDLGIWHSALALPSTIVTPLAGILLDIMERFSANLAINNNHKDWHLGYVTLFVLSIFFSLSSVIAASRIDLKKEKELTVESFEDDICLLESK